MPRDQFSSKVDQDTRDLLYTYQDLLTVAEHIFVKSKPA